VLIGPEPEKPIDVNVAPSDGERAVPSPAGDRAPGLRVRKEEKVELEVAPSVKELVRSCGTKLLGATLTLANAPNQGSAVGALNVFRAVVDLESCIQSTLERVALRARQERAVETCEKNGGEPIGFVLNELTCEVPPDHPIR
jgi:hypothetical protein